MNGRETSSRDLTVYVRYGSNGLQRYLQLHSWNLNGYMAKKKEATTGPKSLEWGDYIELLTGP